jgi:hypothetical protein
MDGMTVAYHPVSTGGRGDVSFSNTIRLPSPTSVIAEISLCRFFSLIPDGNFGASALFDACTTDGSNPPFPPSETFGTPGSISGGLKTVLIRSGLTSISYGVDVSNCEADFVVNVFFWPSVVRGNL